MRKEKTDRGFTWDEEEIWLLTNIWADESLQQPLETCSRKRPIFVNSEAFRGGWFRPLLFPDTGKINQLKKKYKKMKDNNNLPGKNREAFKHFEKMEEVMEGRPITRLKICWLG